MRKLVSGLVLASMAVPGMALAQVRTIQEPDREIVRKVTHVDLGDSELTAGREGPTGSYKVIPRPAKFATRIQLRADFNPELRASTDAIR